MAGVRSKLAWLGLGLLVMGSGAMAQGYRAEIIETKVVCEEKGRYLGWPTICRTRENGLIIAFSGDRDQHVCPYGKTQIIRSDDQGATWSAPVTINNTPLDDRDPGMIETPEGALLLTWFTSVAFERKPEYARNLEKVTPEVRRECLGFFTRRSTDGGKTWDAPSRMAGSAPHGPSVLRGKRLIQVGCIYDGERSLPVETSIDDGRSWQVIGAVPIPKDESYANYAEPHVVELPDGKLFAMFRYQPKEKDQAFMRQSESTDGGRTWSITKATPVYGFPPHVLVMDNGWLVVVYGRRKEPFGEKACVSLDGGATWDAEHEITLCDGVNSDLGYPASVQLADGSILTAYYQDPGPDRDTCVWTTHWRVVPTP